MRRRGQPHSRPSSIKHRPTVCVPFLDDRSSSSSADGESSRPRMDGPILFDVSISRIPIIIVRGACHFRNTASRQNTHSSEHLPTYRYYLMDSAKKLLFSLCRLTGLFSFSLLFLYVSFDHLITSVHVSLFSLSLAIPWYLSPDTRNDTAVSLERPSRNSRTFSLARTERKDSSRENRSLAIAFIAELTASHVRHGSFVARARIKISVPLAIRSAVRLLAALKFPEDEDAENLSRSSSPSAVERRANKPFNLVQIHVTRTVRCRIRGSARKHVSMCPRAIFLSLSKTRKRERERDFGDPSHRNITRLIKHAAPFLAPSSGVVTVTRHYDTTRVSLSYV